jgi:BMFP domain-containing protein YqiC
VLRTELAEVVRDLERLERQRVTQSQLESRVSELEARLAAPSSHSEPRHRRPGRRSS